MSRSLDDVGVIPRAHVSEVGRIVDAGDLVEIEALEQVQAWCCRLRATKDREAITGSVRTRRRVHVITPVVH